MVAPEERMDAKLATKSKSYRRSMKTAFRLFKERFKLTDQMIYDKQRAIEKGVIMGDLESYELDWLPGLVQTLVYERVGAGLSPAHARDIHKAMSAFCRYNHLNYKQDSNELPYSQSIGKMAFNKSQIRTLLDYSAGIFRARNKAVMMVLKDSGLRPVDVKQFTRGSYRQALKNSPVEGFAVFNPIITSKKGVRAHPHIGPDATEAINAYLADEDLWNYFRRFKEASLDDALFIAKKMDGRKGKLIGFKPIVADDITRIIKNLLKGSQLVNYKRYGAYSLRKFHTGRLNITPEDGAPMPLSYIYKLQGRTVKDSIGTYDRPEENGDLTRLYIKQYYKLGLKDTTQEKAVKKLEQEKEDLKEKLYLAEKTNEMLLHNETLRQTPLHSSQMVEAGLNTPQKVAEILTPEMIAQAIASNPELLKQAMAAIQEA